MRKYEKIVVREPILSFEKPGLKALIVKADEARYRIRHVSKVIRQIFSRSARKRKVLTANWPNRANWPVHVRHEHWLNFPTWTESDGSKLNDGS